MSTLTKKDLFVLKVIHEFNNGGITSDCSHLDFNTRKMVLSYTLKGGKCLDMCPDCLTNN